MSFIQFNLKSYCNEKIIDPILNATKKTFPDEPKSCFQFLTILFRFRNIKILKFAN